jgi:V8-like Glu-specific endopeptidase
MKNTQALMVMGMMLLATAALAFALGGGGGATREAATDQVAAATKGRRPLDASTVFPKNTTTSSCLGE